MGYEWVAIVLVAILHIGAEGIVTHFIDSKGIIKSLHLKIDSFKDSVYYTFQTILISTKIINF